MASDPKTETRITTIQAQTTTSHGPGIPHAQNEIHHHSSQQRDGENRRPKAIVKPALSPASDTLCSPVECNDGVDHGCHGDDGEEGGGDAADAVAEVEQTYC